MILGYMIVNILLTYAYIYKEELMLGDVYAAIFCPDPQIGIL